MLKFKKNGIFSRSASEEATASELQEGGVVAVWGSPGSGKTTMAVKIAKYLADKKRNVVLLLCDMTAPMLPCICPASELECERSLGSVLAAAHVTENLVKNNLITHKRLGYRQLQEQEQLPVIRRLLERDMMGLDRLQVQMATAREFFVIVRLKNEKDSDIQSYLSRLQKNLEDQGFKTRLSSPEERKRMLGVYLEQNATNRESMATDCGGNLRTACSH